MDRDTARQEIRQRISCKDYLTKSKSGMYCCPICGSGTGKNQTGALKLYDTNTWYCHACKTNGDVLDLIRQKYGTDYNGALKIAADQLGITIDPYRQENAGYDINNLELDDLKKLYKVSAQEKDQEAAQSAPDQTEYDPYKAQMEQDEIICNAINRAFIYWHNGQELPGMLKKFLCNNTDYEYADSIQEFYRDYGLLNKDGTISEYGQATIEAEKDTLQATQTSAEPAEDKEPAESMKSPENAAGTPKTDYMAYYETCRHNLNNPAAVSYLQARGISVETAAAYWLGYDAEWKSPKALKDGKNPPKSARIIMPVSKNHYIARAISTEVEKKYSKMNETGGGEIEIFNKRALYGDKGAVFVTEGIFDALSIIECGGAAVALNSTSNADKFIKQLQEKPTKAVIILCLDNDKAGEKAAATISDGLDALNIRHITADIAGDHKDPNEALTADRETFTRAIQDAEAQAAAQTIETLPGLMTCDEAIKEFLKADDSYIDIKMFPQFSKTAKIKKNSSVVIAADTGAGKSSLAINFLNSLNEDYPCLYINLEMDKITVLRRLVAIQSGLELDRIEGYKNDERTAEAVNISLKAITGRKPLQIIQGAYLLEDIKKIVEQSTAGREETTIVIIDHSLLVDTQKATAGRYDRFTQISEGLRKMALQYNIILFVLLQQNRTGKADDEEAPKNSSLKESGSWENDATHICFLWYDPAIKKKKLLLTKNRNGEQGEFILNYWKRTQTYREAKEQKEKNVSERPNKTSKRDKQREKLQQAFEGAQITTNGHPTIKAMAEFADVTTTTIKRWIKEYGGCTINGEQVDPAGIDSEVDYTGFVKLTPADDPPEFKADTAGNGQHITASF